MPREDYEAIAKIVEDVIGKDTWKLSEVNVGELEAYEARLKSLAQGTIVENLSK